MSDYTRRSSYNFKAQRGQTLVAALAVLFILLFIGGAFVVNVARNISDSARSRDTEDARALAEAGIKYCDSELNGSSEGADWRPIPSGPIGPNGGLSDPDYFWLAKGFTRLPLKGGRALVRVAYAPDPSNPLGQTIKIESVGRPGELDFNDPTVFVQNQNSPRLRRELVAYKRIGIIDYLRFMTDKDKRNGDNFIGVPGVGHFFPLVFGNPMLGQTANASGRSGTETLYGAPIQSNSNLNIMGDVLIYESQRGVNPLSQQEGLFVAGDLVANQFSDTSIPAGVGNSSTATQFAANGKPLPQAYINVFPDLSQGNGGPITPTNDYNVASASFGPNSNFNTYNGFVRDGSSSPAKNGGIRSIPRVNPPLFDTMMNGTGKLRIRQITSESGSWISSSLNTGMIGWGTGIYIDNNSDRQVETSTPNIVGSYSLPADWTNPNAGFAQSAWQGPFYRPPGVLVELLGDRIRLTRSDGKFFYNSDGTTNSQGNGSTIEIPLSDAARAALPTLAGAPPVPAFPHDGDEPDATGKRAGNETNVTSLKIDPHSYGVNVILFAEGNIRVKGVYGTLSDMSSSANQLSRVHLTLVTGGTAYIEGNVIKGDGTVSGGQVVLQRNSTCQIIAKDYVCVNTSMFIQPSNQTNVWTKGTLDLDTFATEIGLPRLSVDMRFSNGVDPGTYGMSQMLFISHASQSPGPTAINLLINPVLDNGSGNTSYLWGGNGPTYPLGVRMFGGQPVTDPTAIAPQWERTTFSPFDTSVNTNLAQSYHELRTGQPGIDQILRLQVDQTFNSGTNNGFTQLVSYLLSSVAVAPMDIRIEAGIYAQEKSFFIIPGYSFNADATDTRLHYTQTGQRTSYNVQLDTVAQREQKNRYPYVNEPLDIRMTFCGAIAENYTAGIGAQGAWLKNWGYIPSYYGSSTTAQIPNDHLFARSAGPSASLPVGYVAGDPGTNDYRSNMEKTTAVNDFALTRGILFEYDPAFAMPYFHSTDVALSGSGNLTARQNRAMRYLQRTVTYGGGTKTFRQILPPMPRLPVGPDLIYSGQNDSLFGDDIYDTDLYQ